MSVAPVNYYYGAGVPAVEPVHKNTKDGR